MAYDKERSRRWYLKKKAEDPDYFKRRDAKKRAKNPVKWREVARLGMQKFRKEKPERARAIKQRWRKKYPLKTLNQRLLERYGISTEEYIAMWDGQNGLCFICHEPPSGDKLLCVDHCHETGLVRSLLCTRCNAGIGMFRESPELMSTAIEYLRFHSARESKLAA